MSFNIPTLPPSFLDRCLAISEHLQAMKSGSAKLEASPSHFFFSVDHPPGNKESGHSTSQPGPPSLFRRWKIKKKSPSDLRRNARRHEEFLERKRNLAQPAASSSSNPPSSTDLPSSADDVSLISETPMVVENNDIMDTESSDQSCKDVLENENLEAVIKESPSVTNNTEDMETAEVIIPVNGPRNKQKTQDHSQNDSLPSPIPQQNSAIKEDKTEDIRILLCSKNKSTATRLSNHFPKSEFIETHPSSKKHHFFFKVQIKCSNLPKLKNDIHELNDEMNLIMIRVLSEKKNYRPEEQNHCEECDHPYHL